MTELSTEEGSVLPENTSDLDADYKQHLCSLFGESTAEYFLNPSSLSNKHLAWYRDMKNNMRDFVSAEELWNTLRQCSACILKTMETTSMENVCKNQVEKVTTDWQMLIKEDQLQHLSQLRFMFHSAQHNQAYSTLLLHQTPPSPLCALDMTDEPSQHLPATRKRMEEQRVYVSQRY